MNVNANAMPNGAAAGRHCVLVLGMHRSGTSALTRTLSLLGCDLPKTVVGPGWGNDAGHWEPEHVCRLNDALLASAGTRWDDFEAVNPAWFQSPKSAEFGAKAIAILREEYGGSYLFVLKDPRICRIAGWWCDVIESFGANPAIIQIVRNPLEVGDSLKKRDKFDESLGILLWLRNTLDAEHQTRGRARAFVSHDRLLETWSDTLTRAQVALGLAWPIRPASAAAAIEEFLSAKLRHHHRPKTISSDGSNAWAAEAFAILDRWAVGRENSDDYEALDRIRVSLDAAGHAFARLVALQWRDQSEAARLQTTALAAEKAAAEAEKKSAGLAAEIASLKSRLAQTESALKQRSVEVEETAAGLAATTAQAAALTTELAKRVEEVAALTRRDQEREIDLAKRVAEIAALTRRDQEREAAVAELSVRLSKQSENAIMIERVSAARVSESNSLKSTLGEMERRLTEREATLSKLGKRIAESTSEADGLRRELAQKAEIIDDANRSALGIAGKAIRAIAEGPIPVLFKGKELKRRAAMLAASGLFDAEWYRRRYEDVAKAGTDPARHFVEFGAREGRFPNERLEQARKEGQI